MADKLFISYSHQDDRLLDRLHKHLAQMERDQVISGWYDREIHAGSRLDDTIVNELESASVFLACVSPDYIASDYCYDKELARALERESDGQLIIVPVVFEPCDWLATPLAQFMAVPTDGKPVSEHTNENVAFLDVVSSLRRSLSDKQANANKRGRSEPDFTAITPSASTRYRVQKEFDELHKRDFVDSGFDEIFRFLEASSRELASIPDVECRVGRPSDTHISCTVINRGKSRAVETVHLTKNARRTGVDMLYGEQYSSTSSNGGFAVSQDEYQLYFTAAYFGFTRDSGDKQLTAKQVGQMIWDELLSKVGIDYA